MTTYTQTEFATRIMHDLGLLGAEEVLSAADLDFVNQTIDSDVALLAAMGIPIWSGSEIAVPPEYLTSLSQRIGLSVAVAYGLMDPVSAQTAKRSAEQALIVLANPRGGSPMVMRADDSRRGRGSFNFTTGQ